MFIVALLIPYVTNARTPIEHVINSHGIAMEMTTNNFVIENFGEDFITGNMVVMIESKEIGDYPTLNFMFDDISSKNRSSNLLKQDKALLKFIFDDGMILSATCSIKKGYGGYSPVCLSCCISQLTMPSEISEISKPRNSRNLKKLTSNRIKQIQAGDYLFNIRTSVASEPLLDSIELFNDMFSDLRQRYPNHLNLK